MSNLTRRVNRNELFIPFEQHFNKFFEEFFENPLIVDAGSAYPKIDAFTRYPIEAEGCGSIGVKEFVVQATVPGVAPNDLRIEISNDNVLTISGKYDRPKESDNESYYYIKEFSSSSFKRSLKLLNGVTGDPKVEIKDGVLTLVWSFMVPSESSEKGRLIAIPSVKNDERYGERTSKQCSSP